MTQPNNLSKNPIHLGLGATSIAQPQFTGMDWYEEYGQRHGSDGAEGRLVSMHTFSNSWDTWEVHPEGSEVVICLRGTIKLIQEIEGKQKTILLKSNEYAINPPGVWHTADVESEATALFITSGIGTEHRKREL